MKLIGGFTPEGGKFGSSERKRGLRKRVKIMNTAEKPGEMSTNLTLLMTFHATEVGVCTTHTKGKTLIKVSFL